MKITFIIAFGLPLLATASPFGELEARGKGLGAVCYPEEQYKCNEKLITRGL